MCPSLPPYDLHTQSLCVDPFRDVCDCYSYFPNDVNSCPYYEVSNEAYARLNSMIETMNERHEHFVTEMRKFSLLQKIDPNLPFLRLEASLYMIVSLPFP